MSEQVGNVFKMPPRAVNPLIPLQLHQSCWEGKVKSTAMPEPLLSHRLDGRIFSFRRPKTTGTTQGVLCPLDNFGQGQSVPGLHLYLPVHDLPKPTHGIRVRAGTKHKTACCLILPSESSAPKCFGQMKLLKTAGKKWKRWAWGGK